MLYYVHSRSILLSFFFFLIFKEPLCLRPSGSTGDAIYFQAREHGAGGTLPEAEACMKVCGTHVCADPSLLYSFSSPSSKKTSIAPPPKTLLPSHAILPIQEAHTLSLYCCCCCCCCCCCWLHHTAACQGVLDATSILRCPSPSPPLSLDVCVSDFNSVREGKKKTICQRLRM